MLRKTIDFLDKLSNSLTYIANSLRDLRLHEEYYVYIPSNNKPRYIHKSYKSARAEAERLCDKISCIEQVEILQIVNKFEGHQLPF